MKQNNKQDLCGVRTAQDLEKKYDLGAIVGLKKATRNSLQGINKTNETLQQFIKATLGSLEDMQKQVDGQVMTWFYEGVPTLDNVPASEWLNDTEKTNHIGDLYYDRETGYSYRFTINNGQYEWFKISDSDITEALAIANAANDTADSKRRVFIVTPKPPYDNGDLWFKDGEIYICQITKGEGETYAEKDFIIATKYTDDTYAKQVGDELTVLSGVVTTIKEGVDEFSVEIKSTVKTQGKEIETANTKIKANTEEIELRVKKNGVIGSINLSEEEAKISAEKIELHGAVTISSLDDGLKASIDEINNLELGGRNLQIGTSETEFIVTAGNTNMNLEPIKVSSGKQYTISFDVLGAQAVNSNTLIIQYYENLAQRKSYKWITVDLTTSWQRISRTVTIANNINYLKIGIRNTNGNIAGYNRIKVEEGNKASPWVPAIEDIDNAIASVKNTADEANNLLSEWAYKTGDGTRTYIDGGKLYTGSVVTNSIASNAITTDKIGSKAINTEKLDVDEIFGNSAVLNILTAQEAFINAISTNEVVVGVGNAANNALDAVKELEIGTVNLLINSSAYRVNNKYVIPADKDNYNVKTSMYAVLEADTEYIFDIKTDGVWGYENGTDTVQAYLLKDNAYTYYVDMNEPPYAFIVKYSGTYYLRLDVNQEGQTHSFWDIQIKKGNKCGDWSPAIEDTDNAIASAKSTADEANNLLSEWAYKTGEGTRTYIDGGKLYTGTVVTNSIASNAITTDKIGSKAINTEKLDVDEVFGNSAVLSTLTAQEAFIAAINTNEVVVGANATANKALETINNIEVGGRNLVYSNAIVNHTGILDKANYSKSGTIVHAGGTGLHDGFKYDLAVMYQPSVEYIVSFSLTKTSGTVENFYMYNGKGHTFISFMIDGVEYGDCMSTGNANINTSCASTLNDGNEHHVVIKYKTAETIPVDTGVAYTYIQINKMSEVEVTVKYSEFKLEKGNKATDWSPAIEDTDNAIASAKSTADEANNLLSEWAYKTGDGTRTYIDGSKLYTGSVVTNSIAANAIKAEQIDVDDLFAQNIVASGSIQSENYKENTSGIKIDLSNGAIDTKNFKVTSTGDITANSGKIGGFTIATTELKYGTWGTSGGVLLMGAGSSASKIIGGSNSISGWTLAIGSTFGVTKEGKMYVNSGKIAGIDITANGLQYSGTDTYDGFGLWKNGVHSHNDSYIIMHAGANGSHISSAKFRIYQDGSVYASNLNVLGGSITGGSINIGSGAFTVSTAGAVICSNVTVTGGRITLGDAVLDASGLKVGASGGSSTIGSFKIDENSIFRGSWSSLPDVFICSGTTGTYSIGGRSGAGWVFGAGSKFGVTKNGELYCTSGNIGGFNISNSQLSGGATGTYMVLHPKGITYNGGTKRYYILFYRNGTVYSGLTDTGVETIS